VSAGAGAPADAGRIYVTDCEGPLTRNDNAQEIAERFVPDGAEFFARLSKYDDFLVDVAAKPGYNAGNTLRLIPPFFKAYYVTDEDIEEFSAEQVLLVPRALKTLDAVSALMPAFIISTSYTPYLKALCEITGFPLERVRCTELSLDAWQLPEDEAEWLREWVPRVCARPVIDYPVEAMTAAGGHAAGDAGADPGVPGGAPWRSPDAALAWLTEEDRATVRELDRLFWTEMPEHQVSQALTESVRPVGGGQKLAALEEIVAAQGVEGSGVMYVGDSITDTPPLAAVKAWGGVSLSFNGNGYSIAAAEFAAASPDAEVQAQVAQAFASGGREAVEAAVRAWPKPKERVPVRGKARATVGIVAEAREALTEASAAARLSVRGERVARLG
jgi:energy-converting hydrogenase A subunit R